MADLKDKFEDPMESSNANEVADKEEYSLSDDRRVKVLSPGQLVAKRFFRNRLAVTGLVILVIMFLFAYLGGVISPYEQNQQFYRVDSQSKDYAGVIHNEEYRYTVADKDLFKSSVQAQALMNIIKENDSFEYNGVSYTLEKLDNELYTVSSGGNIVGIASKELVTSSTADKLSFDFTLNAFRAKAEKKDSFTADGKSFKIDQDGINTATDGTEEDYLSSYIIQAVMGDVFCSREF